MKNIIETDKNYQANTYLKTDVNFVSGSGSYLFDLDGKKYIDFGSGIAVNTLGVSEKGWAKEIYKQAKKLNHTSNLFYNEPSTKLCELLCKKSGMNKVFLCNSGAEANECAIKTARKYSFDKYGTDRYEIITLKGSFHGRTLATLSATGQDSFHTKFNPFLEGFKYVKANDFDDFKNSTTDKTCAVMLELIQGEGGVNVLDKEYVKRIKAFCDSKDILLIIDEVQTGNGRTGYLYAYMGYGITPDIVTTAKGLGGGLPIGACIFNFKTQNVLSLGDHGSTFGGNPICSSGAIYILNHLNNDLLISVREKSAYIFEKINSFENVKEVTGMGLMIGISIKVGNNKEIMKKCKEKGLIVLTAKEKIRLLPALTIDYETIEEGLKILKEVIENEASVKTV